MRRSFFLSVLWLLVALLTTPVLADAPQVTDKAKAEIEAAIAEAKTAIEGGDPEEMTAKTQALTEKAMKMGQAIYEKEQAAQASPGAEGPAADAAEDVVDAEFSEVDENKG